MNIKKLSSFTLIAGLVLAVSMLPACKKSTSTPTPVVSGLYDSLGGTTLVADPSNSGQMIEKGYLGIRSVVDSAIFVIAGDNQINGSFAVLLAEVGKGDLSGFQALSNNLSTFIAVAAGAQDFTYGGKSMSDAHNPAYNARMTGTVSTAAFTEFINDVGTAAAQNGLSTQLTGQVAARLETVQSQVVNQ